MKQPTAISKLETHIRKWSACTLCPLHENRDQIVLYRGHIPCDLLLIGEAPGESENAIGQPFIGPAGRVLDSLIKESQDLAYNLIVKDNDNRANRAHFTYAITNVVACIPFSPEADEDIKKPNKDCIQACQPRLAEFITLANPRIVVAMGEVAKSWIAPNKFNNNSRPKPLAACLNSRHVTHIQHPSFMLRNGGVGSLPFKRAALHLADTIRKYL